MSASATPRTPFLRPARFAALVVATLGLLAGPALAADPEPYEVTRIGVRGPSFSPASIIESQITPRLVSLEAEPGGITLARPDGSTLSASLVRFERRGAGNFTWQGRVQGGGSVTLSARGGALAGRIVDGDEIYEIIPRGERGTRIALIDEAALGACETDDGDGVEFHDGDLDLDLVPSGTVSTIDLLAVYSPQALAEAGSVAAIEATIQAAVDAANTAFVESDVAALFNLVHVAPVTRSDSGSSSADLDWLVGDPTVRDLRDQHYADMVGLVAANIGTGSCGRARVQRTISPDFSESAFQVTRLSCAVGNLSYAHEHGHNLGFEHDPDYGVPPGDASATWSFGHYHDGQYRTLMSYSNNCTLGCTRVERWSNPDVDYLGLPTGIADARDNHRTGNLSAPIAADFRIAGLDSDGDGVEDIFDNCPDDPNPGQEDGDGDGLGDVCDLDIDQVAKLVNPSPTTGDKLGWAADLDGDVVVGGSWLDDNSAGANAGAAFVYTGAGDSWTAGQEILPADAVAEGKLGYSVDVSGDTLVIGSSGGSPAPPGAAYVYRRNGASWSLEQKLVPASPGPSETTFGYAVAIDGDTIAVGASNLQVPVRIFDRNGTTWTEGQSFPNVRNGTHFGQRLLIDGDRLLISERQNQAGAVFVYERDNGTFSLQDTLTPDDGASLDYFGNGLASAGDIIVVGGQHHDAAGTSAGAAYVFRQELDGTWTQEAKLQGDGLEASDWFGHSVAANATIVAVGTPGDDGGAGAVYLFEATSATRGTGTTWTQYSKVIANDARGGDRFGHDVTIDGDQMLVSAESGYGPPFTVGSLYVFGLPNDDRDGDGIPNADDNCPDDANPGQEDADDDGLGDVCDDCTDIDGDGYGSPGSADCPAGASEDCDDDDASVSPGATELCNGIDDDCFQGPDQSFPDLGDSCSVGVGVCEADGNQICTVDGLGTQCDATPGSPGVEGPAGDASCSNGLDDDCDGLSDGDDPDCVLQCTDIDGDGYSIEGGACGAVDCNDGDPNVNPGASEIPGNGIDDDCNPDTPTGCNAEQAVASTTAAPAGGAGVPVSLGITVLGAWALVLRFRRDFAMP